MALSIASLNSGSNGNCYYVGNEEGAVLIDAGLSCKEIERRMDRLGLSMSAGCGGLSSRMNTMKPYPGE